jgi:flagellar basal body-associated protein FliL
MKPKSESGLAHVVMLILIIVVLGAIFFVGMRVIDQDTSETSGSVPLASSKATTPSTIKTAADLNTAKAELNQTNVDNDLNPASLDSDLNDVL